MMHTDEKMMAQMVAEVIGRETIIDCYFNNDANRLT